MNIVKRLTFISLLFPSLVVAGNLTPMSQEELTTTFNDKTITTISAATLNKKIISDSFTGYFSNDGKMVGRFATKPKDQPQHDTGTWKVKPDGMFCYKWNHWNSGNEKCAAIYKLSNGLLVINSDNGFESFILDADIKSGNHVPK